MKKSEIMTRAHAWTRETLAAHPGDDYRATLAAALREIWSEARTETARSLAAVRLTIAALLQHAEDVTGSRTPAPAAAAQEAAQEAAARQQDPQQQPQTLHEFFAAPGELQLQMIRRLATRCPDRAMNRTRAAADPETGERLFNEDGDRMREFITGTWAAWMTPRKRGGLGLVPWDEAVEEVTAEAWMILQRINPAAQEAAAGIAWGQKKPLKVKDGEPLGLTLARAADLACYQLDRQHRDRPGFYAKDPGSLDDPDFSMEAHLPGPEPAAALRESIRTAARSEQDLAILDLAAQGYNRVEIGRALGITRQAIEKHLRKMKNRLNDVKTEQAANDLDAAVMAAAGVQHRRPRTWTPDNASTGSTGSSSPAAALYSGSKPSPQERPQAAQERPQAETMTRSTGSSEAAQDAALAAEMARREAAATRSLARLAARQARSR